MWDIQEKSHSHQQPGDLFAHSGWGPRKIAFSCLVSGLTMLVGGLPTPLKNMKVSWGFLFPISGLYNTMISHRFSIGFLLLMGVYKPTFTSRKWGHHPLWLILRRSHLLAAWSWSEPKAPMVWSTENDTILDTEDSVMYKHLEIHVKLDSEKNILLVRFM